jgi:hypothetical protein
MATQYQRLPLDYVFGTLAAAAAVSDTTISSAAFANLGTTYTNGTTVLYTPIVLHNPALGLREVVWVVGHTAASQTVTVLRGQEGTTAQAWPSGTQVLCAPTAARDGLGLNASTALPANAHLGYRNAENDNGLTVEQTSLAGWQASVGVCLPTDAGPTDINGITIPAGATIIERVGLLSGVTVSASGQVVATFRTPFPNGAIGAFAINTATARFNGVITLDSLSSAAATFHLYNISGGALVSSTGGTFSCAYLAVGW